MRSINKMTQAIKELTARYPQDASKTLATGDMNPDSYWKRRKYNRCARALARIMDKFACDYPEKLLERRYKAVYRRYGADRVNAVLACTAAALPEKEKTTTVATKEGEKTESIWGSITDEYGKTVRFEDWSPRGWDKTGLKPSSITIKLGDKKEKRTTRVNYLPTMVDRFAAIERSNCDMSRPHYKTEKGKDVLRFAIPVCAIERRDDGRTFLRLPRKGTKDDAAWTISLDRYSEITPDVNAKAPDGKVMISIPKGMHMKVIKNSESDKLAKFRITAESLSSILYHATEEDYAPDETRPRLTRKEKERFDAATKGSVYGKQTRELFDGKDGKGDLEKSRENFMTRLAFIFDGNKKTMAHVFECSGLNNGMSPEARNVLANTACKKVTKHYSDVMCSSARAEKKQKTAAAASDDRWVRAMEQMNK